MAVSVQSPAEYPALTVYGLLEQSARRAPGATALDFFDKRTDFSEFLEKIELAAGALSVRGFGAGDVITVCMPNTPQAVTLFYAASRLGATANMLHPQSAQNEIRFGLELTGSRIIFTLDMFYETVIAAVRSMDRPVTVVVCRIEDELPLFAVAARTLSGDAGKYADFPYENEGILWKSFLKEGRRAGAQAPAEFDRDHTAVILYSGGTSGRPKGIRLSDYAFNACVIQATRAIGMEYEPGSVILACMPCFHGFGLGINLHAALVSCVTCVLMPSFDIKTYSKLMLTKRPNYIAGVPTIFDALVGLSALENADLSFLKGAFCGGDSLPPALKKRVDDFFRSHGASIQLREGYGLTEAVAPCCLTPRDSFREGSIGLAYEGTEIAIVRPGTGEFLPAGEAGEIVISGPALMQGYVAEPEETADCMKQLADGRIWLYTGDLARMDEDGYVYFLGRLKRMLITNGYNVYPAELERVIGSCPLVREVCVVGVKDPRRMQKIRACIVPAEGAAQAEVKAAVKELLRLNIAKYAQPRELVFRDSLPHTAAGKIDFRQVEAEENA